MEAVMCLIQSQNLNQRELINENSEIIYVLYPFLFGEGEWFHFCGKFIDILYIDLYIDHNSHPLGGGSPVFMKYISYVPRNELYGL